MRKCDSLWPREEIGVALSVFKGSQPETKQGRAPPALSPPPPLPPPMDTYETTDKYHCTTATLEQTVAQYGVAILPSVLSPAECEELRSLMWDFVEGISQTWERPLSRHDESTWGQVKKLLLSHGMLCQWYGVGHCQAAWTVRQNPNVVAPFAAYYKCDRPEDLLTSFDGMSFGLPPEVTKRGWFRGTWLHTDQSYTRNEHECLQAWVTAEDVEPGDGTLAFYEGSHLLHAEFAQRFGVTEKGDWYQLKEAEQVAFYRTRCGEVKRIVCPRGSMVFWDSRTIHCGSEPMRGRPNPKLRAVVYACYQPRACASQRAIEKKRKAFEERRTTSHWPARPKLFGKRPRTYGAALPEVTPPPDPVLTALGTRLAGF